MEKTENELKDEIFGAVQQLVGKDLKPIAIESMKKIAETVDEQFPKMPDWMKMKVTSICGIEVFSILLSIVYRVSSEHCATQEGKDAFKATFLMMLNERFKLDQIGLTLVNMQ